MRKKKKQIVFEKIIKVDLKILKSLKKVSSLNKENCKRNKNRLR